MEDDNRDQYGYRHREDQFHDVGDPKPGDVGDSEGTFHDRARKNQNVNVDGKVQSVESHQRSSAEVNRQTSGQNRESSGDSIPQSEADGKVVTVVVDSYGGTRDTIATYKNHQVHIDGGKPGEKIPIRLECAQGYMVGSRVKSHE